MTEDCGTFNLFISRFWISLRSDFHHFSSLRRQSVTLLIATQIHSALTHLLYVCLLGILRQTDKRQQEKPRKALLLEMIVSFGNSEQIWTAAFLWARHTHMLCDFNISSCKLQRIRLRKVTLLVRRLLQRLGCRCLILHVITARWCSNTEDCQVIFTFLLRKTF